MLTHKEMVGLQAEKHDLIDTDHFHSKEKYVLHLIHSFAYTRAAGLAAGKTVLDLGCNTGYGSNILAAGARRVVGVDVAARAVARAREQYGRANLDFQVIDGQDLPFRDSEFDLVISCQVIEHIVDHSAYLAELKRVLKPAGLAFITTPNASLRLDPGMKPWNEFHVREYDHAALQEQLRRHFDTVSTLGLWADEPLYSLEKRRLSRARQVARKPWQSWLRSTARKLLPAVVTNGLRRLPGLSIRTKLAADDPFTRQYGLDNLCYRPDELNDALDLLAVCSDDDKTRQQAVQWLINRQAKENR